MNLNKLIGERLTNLMTENNITVRELAKKTGLSHGTISGVRNGKNHYTWQLMLICKQMGISIEILTDESLSQQKIRALNAIHQIDCPALLDVIATHTHQLKKLKLK